MKLKQTFIFSMHWMFNVQAQTAKKVLLKTNASANKDLKTPVVNGILSLPQLKET
jgi:hypothetical protein